MTKRPAALFLLLAATLCLVYASTSARVVGELIPPLDDTFIHFQYARRLAEGHPFSYQAGDGYSSGATSLLWPCLLAIGWLIGFRSESLYLWALVLGTVSLAATATYTLRWVSRVADERTGWFAAAAILGSGPLLWGSFSGMEVPLFGAAIAATLEGLTRPGRRPGEPVPGALIWAGVLASVRPEGALFAGTLALAQVGEGWLAERRLRGLLWFAPVTLGAVQPLMNLWATGMVGSASALAKQNTRFGHVNEFSFATSFWDAAVWGGYGDQFFGRLALPVLALFAVGAWTLVLRDVRDRRAGPGVMGFGWWLITPTLLAAVLPIWWHHYRYLQPGLVIVLPLFVVGANQVDRAIARLRDTTLFPFVAATLVASMAFADTAWVQTLARNATDIRGHQVEQARWVAENLPADATIAANDVGAITYLGGHHVLDLEGIVSLDLLDDALDGEGSTYARILERRPAVLVIFPEWFPSSFASGAMTVRRHARLSQRTISGGNDLAVATLDAAVAGTAERPPALPEGERIIDELDLSDLDSERSHEVRYEDAQPARGRANRVISARYGEEVVVDSARRLQGAFEATFARGGPRALIGRFGPSEAPARLLVRVDGADVGVWTVPAIAEGTWSDERFALPTSGTRIELVPVDVSGGPLAGWHVARMWIVSSGG